ncbi:hypothetical protein [Pseudomonas aeruginosa]|nr:hypothetical protein [Pseudomonas aeruginosa]
MRGRLVGGNAGRLVTCYTSQCELLFFRTQVLWVDGGTANCLRMVAL